MDPKRETQGAGDGWWKAWLVLLMVQWPSKHGKKPSPSSASSPKGLVAGRKLSREWGDMDFYGTLFGTTLLRGGDAWPFLVLPFLSAHSRGFCRVCCGLS